MLWVTLFIFYDERMWFWCLREFDSDFFYGKSWNSNKNSQQFVKCLQSKLINIAVSLIATSWGNFQRGSNFIILFTFHTSRHFLFHDNLLIFQIDITAEHMFQLKLLINYTHALLCVVIFFFLSSSWKSFYVTKNFV